MTAIGVQAVFLVLCGVLAYAVGRRLGRHGDGLVGDRPDAVEAGRERRSLTRMVVLGVHLLAAGTAVLLLHVGRPPDTMLAGLSWSAPRIAVLLVVLGIVELRCLSILIEASRCAATGPAAGPRPSEARPPRHGRADPLDRVFEAARLDAPSRA